MKNIKYNYRILGLMTALIFTLHYGCERKYDALEPATFPTTADVFIDGFSTGLGYEAWGDVTAFSVDTEVKYSGNASMKFAVPDEGQTGGYAGGRYVTTFPRDLSGYDALTFWAKASKAASIDKIGFGNNAQGSKYLATINEVVVNTNWKKFIIPLPDPSKLTRESGLLYYTEAPEDGAGYTFWMDEVKFEKLGTLAHQQPEILDGTDKVSTAFNGLNIPIVGFSYVANLPNGVNQLVEVAPSYFTFSSSNNNTATVDELGMVSVRGAGTAVIKASIAGGQAAGSLTVKSNGEFVHAPVPTVEQDKVISIFSNAYTNVPVDFYNGFWQPYQTTLSSDFKVGDDNVLGYTNFNFVGIQFTTPAINAASMKQLHMDVWIPSEVDPSFKLTVKVVDMGPDGALDGNDPTLTYNLPSPLVSGSWMSVDINLAGLSSKSKLAQIIFDNLGSPLSNFFVDNIYLYSSGTNLPAEAAPTPPVREAANVISIYGDAYTNLPGTDYPNWGQATVVSDVSVGGNNTLKLTGLNYQGIQLASSQNVSGMQFLHLDYWTENSTTLNAYLISPGPAEKVYALTVPTTGWVSVDIPMTAFSGVNLADVIQFKFDGNGDIYLDNIYFYKTGGGAANLPTIAATTPPARDAADVMSFFSNAYTNKTIDAWSASWDDSDVTDVQVAGDDVKKFAFTNFAGVDFSNHKLDASGMTRFHMDLWTPDEVVGKSLTVKWVHFGGGSAEASSLILTLEHTPKGEIPALAKGSWVSIDVPISAFGGNLTRSDLAQLVLSSNLKTVYIDNLYLYKTGGGTATVPTLAAPTPTRLAGDVISIYSDAYTNINGVNLNPGWGQSTVVTEVPIAGNKTQLYTGLNYQGIDFDSNHQNVSAMQLLHLDFWTANSTLLKIYLISPGNEKPYTLTVPTNGNWTSIDIPLTNFSPVDLANVFQFKFEGNGDIYVDNIYFFKGTGGGGGGGTDTGPTAAAPTPPARNAANVVSIYSDAYANISFNNFDAGWCGGAAVTAVKIDGNNTLKKNAGINCHGIDFSASKQNLSSFTHIHFDFYTTDTDLTGDVFNIKLVDFAGGNGEVSALEININTGTTPKIVAGTWVSVDVNITSLGGVVSNKLTRSDVAQIGITTANLTNVWYDNIYLYK